MSNSNNLYEAPDLGKYVLVPSFQVYSLLYFNAHSNLQHKWKF